VELSFALHLDEAGVFKLLDVVRESDGGDGQRRQGLRAAQSATGFGDALKEFEAARVCERLEDGGAAGAREAEAFGGGCARLFNVSAVNSGSLYWMLWYRARHFSRQCRPGEPIPGRQLPTLALLDESRRTILKWFR
jgi:hypothetical protein